MTEQSLTGRGVRESFSNAIKALKNNNVISSQTLNGPLGFAVFVSEEEEGKEVHQLEKDAHAALSEAMSDVFTDSIQDELEEEEFETQEEMEERKIELFIQHLRHSTGQNLAESLEYGMKENRGVDSHAF